MSLITDKDVELVVSRAIGSNEQVQGFRLEPFTKIKDGLLGSHYLLSVDVKDKNNSGTRSYTFFLKTPPESTLIQDCIMDEETFYEEMNFYKNIHPLMLENYNGDKWYANCYLTKPGILVYEDLRVQGFATRTDNLMDVQSLKTSVASLAKFHACSIMAETKLGKTLKEAFPSYFEEKMYTNTNKFGRGTKVGYKALVLMAESVGLDPTNVPKIMDFVHRNVRPKRGRVNVVCHSDLWKNNIMFNSNVPPECIIVDFQILRYASFACDLGMLLYLNTTPDFRKQSEMDIFKHYYFIFNQTLQQSKIKVNIPSYESMLREYEELKLVGMSYAAMYLPAIYMNPDDFTALFNDPIYLERYFLYDRFELLKPQLDSDPIYAKKIKNILIEILSEAERVFC